MSKNMSPLLEALIKSLGKDDIDVIGACSVIYNGGLFLSETDIQVLCNLLFSKQSDDSIVCDYGYVGSHVTAALIALGSLDRIFEYVDSLDQNSLDFEIFYEGVTDFFESCRYGDQKAEKLMSILVARFPNAQPIEQAHISSSLELAFCELGISALRLAENLPSLINEARGSIKSELKLAVSRVIPSWSLESIEKLRKFI